MGTKRYEAGSPVTMSGASYEVRLTEDGTIAIDNINGIDAGTLYAKKGSTPVKISGDSHNLEISGDISSVGAAAIAIKSILYVLNVPEGEAPSNEEITNAVNIAGGPAEGITFANIEKIN